MILREYIREILVEQAHALTLYHGTGLANLPSIMTDGLKAYKPRGAPHGQRGVYLTSNVELSARYAHGELSGNENPIVLEVRISKRKRTKKLVYDPLDRASMWQEDGGYDDEDIIGGAVDHGFKQIVQKLTGKDLGYRNYTEKILGTSHYREAEDLDGVPLYQNAVRLLMADFGVEDRRAAMKAVQEEWPSGDDWGDISVSESGTLQITQEWYEGREQLIYPESLPPSTIKAVWVKCDQYDLPLEAYSETKEFGQEELPGEAKSRYENRDRFFRDHYGKDWSQFDQDDLEEVAEEAEALGMDEIRDVFLSGDVDKIAMAMDNAGDWIHDEWGEQQTTGVGCWGKLTPQEALKLTS